MFADCLGRNKDLIGQTFNMVLPSGDVMLSSYWLRVVPVVISERELSVDLVILDMIDYDVILVMDFFSGWFETNSLGFAIDGSFIFGKEIHPQYNIVVKHIQDD